MKRSSQHILTTHTGSLPRPPDLVQLIRESESGTLADRGAFEGRVREAVNEAVRRQADAGIDVVNDGEMGKPGYATYIKDRATGFGGPHRVTTVQAEARDFPEFTERRVVGGGAAILRPSCNGPIAWKDFAAVQRDIDNLKAATAGASVEEVFMSSASPGVIAIFLGNEYYPSQEAYLAALASVMRDEYNAIHQAGFLLQLDCPDLAMSRHLRFGDLNIAEFCTIVAQHVAVLNEATKDIPPDRMRLHLCWGNYEGPHHLDVPLAEIIDIVLTARPAAISFEGANPRHEHEWKVWKDTKLPPGKLIIPGVIDSTTNFIEHPELVAERIYRYAELVGRENVIAGSDCGFGTFATSSTVDPRITWAKLRSLAEGARIASDALW
ncbi:MAG TPA: cobalamin-independent methionine synthase II family protein [Dehalococcoidia bacterium]|nr:cobalamin-independent methionine synthase II family protein [Dehalococcoidia bacterium]